MKNSPEFYGQEYLEGVIGGSGGKKRKEDNGAYYQSGVFIKRFLVDHGIEKPKTLDVGCGLGYVVRHLRNQGVDAHGCEYGTWTVENAVIPGIIWADLTEGLPYEADSFDLVSCLGVLSQFPAEFAVKAVEELKRVSRRFIFVNIQCMKYELQKHHRNIKPPAYWERILESLDLKTFDDEYLRATYAPYKMRMTRILEK